MMTAAQKYAPVKLGNTFLGDLPSAFARPSYDRESLAPGILHIGLGNFHRAHQAVYLNDLLNAGGDPAWGILGAGVREPDVKTRELLESQDWLYSVVEVDGQDYNASIIGAMQGFVPVQPDGNAPLIRAMSNPATRIVSLTVTEGGYFLDGEGAFDRTNQDVIHDIQNQGSPRTTFGAILAALAARKTAGDARPSQLCPVKTCQETATLHAKLLLEWQTPWTQISENGLTRTLPFQTEWWTGSHPQPERRNVNC